MPLIESPGAHVYRDLRYVADGHERHILDLYTPGSPAPRPVVVWIHGGAFWTGDKTQGVPRFLLDDGYAIASVNYRLSPHARFPAQVEDARAAVRWLRAHAGEYGLDRRRFVAMGESAGGHLAAMLGTAAGARPFDIGGHLGESAAVQAVIDFFGPTDFVQMDRHRLPGGLAHDEHNSPESTLMGWPIQRHPDRVAAANPITYATRDTPPFLIVHGDADLLVPHHQSTLLADALRETGVSVTFHTVPGGGHGEFDEAQTMAWVRAFLATALPPAQGAAFM